MLRFLNRFRREESGAITVEWVVLTAMLLGLFFLLFGIFETAATESTEATGGAIENIGTQYLN